MAQVTISYERKFSDGNYGSEGVSFSISADFAPETDSAQAQLGVSQMLRTARLAVLQALAQSAREAVRYVATNELRHHDYPLPPGVNESAVREPR